MQYKETQILLERYDEGRCTAEEKELVESYFLQLKKGQAAFDLDDEVLMADLDDIWLSVQSARKTTSRGKVWSFRRWGQAAASILLVSGILGYLYWSGQGSEVIDQDVNVTVQQVEHVDKSNYSVTKSVADVDPAQNVAELILSTGERISLADYMTGEVRFDQLAQIDLLQDGELSYKSEVDNTGESPKNTLIVPKGGVYNITLADGSKVMLNAGSKLTFPIYFNGLTREVYLEGEAYFDITKREITSGNGNIKQEFVVKTSDSRIRVLGTKFNVKAYPREHRNKMTLAEGSIELSVDRREDRKVVLKPGQQAITEEQSMTIEEVSVENELAWIKGDFVFNGDNVEDIMNQIGRWYNMDIVYLGQIPEEKYISTISRSKTLKEVLQILESTTEMKFSIQKDGKERRIVVVP